uniref:Uncharacterized protein n=1 Tax=Rhipicephalus zambeziensis TaxID=60191 RepID=A0A224Y6W9_9ACAR
MTRSPVLSRPQILHLTTPTRYKLPFISKHLAQSKLNLVSTRSRHTQCESMLISNICYEHTCIRYRLISENGICFTSVHKQQVIMSKHIKSALSCACTAVVCEVRSCFNIKRNKIQKKCEHWLAVGMHGFETDF